MDFNVGSASLPFKISCASECQPPSRGLWISTGGKMSLDSSSTAVSAPVKGAVDFNHPHTQSRDQEHSSSVSPRQGGCGFQLKCKARPAYQKAVSAPVKGAVDFNQFRINVMVHVHFGVSPRQGGCGFQPFTTNKVSPSTLECQPPSRGLWISTLK